METENITLVDKIAMALGGGLVLLGTAVFGFFETLLGNPHAVAETNEAGDVIAHTTFDPQLRAYIIAAGLLIWGLFAVYKLTTGVPRSETKRSSSREGEPAK